MWSGFIWVVGAAGLLGIGLSVAVLAGRARFRRAAVLGGALAFSLGLLGLSWGVVHGLHSMGEMDEVARRDGIMAGIAPGLNAFQLGLLCVVLTLVLLLIDALRGARESSPRSPDAAR